MKVIPNLAVLRRSLAKTHGTYIWLIMLPFIVSVQYQLTQGRSLAITAIAAAVMYVATFLFYFVLCVWAAKRQVTRDPAFRAEFEAATDAEKGRLIGTRFIQL
ncbi:MAG: hypothetical protein R3C27_04655 [Hyphomonadaceae bacterium]